MITQKELKEMLHYNPKTGIFSWKVSRKAGAEAGWFDKKIKYIRIELHQKTYLSHRLAWLYMTGEWPKNIDHIDHNKTNNKFINLRDVTHQENCKNMPLYANNTSLVAGVYWLKANKKWFASIYLNGKNKTLHYSDDKFEVICARKSAENKHGYHKNHGEHLHLALPHPDEIYNEAMRA